MPTRIKLPGGEWEYDEGKRLGKPGGFGEVFAGSSQSGEPVAVKRLKISVGDAGHRELDIAAWLRGRTFEHVLRILDAGEDALADGYYVVMPVAGRNLQDFIDTSGKSEPKQAASILQQIASGLHEVAQIVHRDLKPANVLEYEGRWVIADFGIAHFVEEATSSQTVKDFLSPPYAAPEQWYGEHADNATDVYALGCIGYALLTGQPSFSGPMRADYEQQHLMVSPPPLPGIPAALQSLLAMMLRKEPLTRPPVSRVITLLKESLLPGVASRVRSGLNELAVIGAAEAEADSRREAQQRSEAAKVERRRKLADDARNILMDQCRVFLDKLTVRLPTNKVARINGLSNQELLYFEVGNASLGVSWFNMTPYIPEGAFPIHGWDVVVGAEIHIVQMAPRQYRWSSNLWYGKLVDRERYRWWEISYMGNPMLAMQARDVPFNVNEVRKADGAASRGEFLVAIDSPWPIDDEDADDFVDRWSKILARAILGELRKPDHFPISRADFGS